MNDRRSRNFLLRNGAYDYAALERRVAAQMATERFRVVRRAGANPHPQGSPSWRSVKRLKLLAVVALLRLARTRLVAVLQDDGQIPESWQTDSPVEEWTVRHPLIRPLDTLIRIIDEETDILDWRSERPTPYDS